MSIPARFQHRHTGPPARPLAIAQRGLVTNAEVTRVLSHNLRSARQAAGLTQRAVATRVELKLQRYGSYEEGRADPPMAVLLRLAAVFGLKVDALFSPATAHV